MQYNWREWDEDEWYSNDNKMKQQSLLNAGDISPEKA